MESYVQLELNVSSTELWNIFKMTDSSYDKLLTRAKLPTLELSRKRAIFVEVYKAVNKLSLLLYGIYSMWKMWNTNWETIIIYMANSVEPRNIDRTHYLIMVLICGMFYLMNWKCVKIWKLSEKTLRPGLSHCVNIVGVYRVEVYEFKFVTVLFFLNS